MASTRRVVQVFISSPDDVRAERAVVVAAVARLNRMSHIRDRLLLQSLSYDTEVPALMGEPPQVLVDRHMTRADRADVVVCIFWSRLGTPVVDADGNEVGSGTEYEFRLAYDARRRLGEPQILLYRKIEEPPADADAEQRRRVDAFFARFSGAAPELEGLYRTFRTAEEFDEVIFHDLDAVVVTHFADGADSARTDAYVDAPTVPHTIPRDELFAQLRDALVSSAAGVAVTSAALHGMGGIGKTVLARMLCDDAEIRRAFSGVLWVTLGREARKLRHWIEVLSGAVGDRMATAETLQSKLAVLLADRACLLILDDVWSPGTARPFLVGGPRCRTVITTRDAMTAAVLGFDTVSVPPLEKHDAIALLDRWSAHAIADEAAKERIVHRLGYLPLAIRLAGPQLRHTPPHDWLRRFDIRRLASTRPSGELHDSLEATFALGLEDLPADMRQFYLKLSIFREDEPIPTFVAARLWKGDGDFDEVAADLTDRALVDLQPGETTSMTLHDLVRADLAARLGVQAMADAHMELVSAYRLKRPGLGWHTAPDDGYLYDHLAYHLSGAGARAHLGWLFDDAHWMHARVKQSDETTSRTWGTSSLPGTLPEETRPRTRHRSRTHSDTF